MKRNKPNAQFWTLLAAVNLLVVTYPISLLIRAESVDESLVATLVLIGSVFLLMVVDAVSIIVGT
jgi:hypothetical protein